MQVDIREVFSYGWAACFAFLPKVIAGYRERMSRVETKIQSISDKNSKQNEQLQISITRLSTQMEMVINQLEDLHRIIGEQQDKTEAIQVDLQRKQDRK